MVVTHRETQQRPTIVGTDSYFEHPIGSGGTPVDIRSLQKARELLEQIRHELGFGAQTPCDRARGAVLGDDVLSKRKAHGMFPFGPVERRKWSIHHPHFVRHRAWRSPYLFRAES